MARLVESVVADYPESVRWEKVITKDLMGAQRFMELTKKLGRPAPVPSIFINGELKFDTTPPGDDLKVVVDRMLATPG
jgi:hypothetical protein